MEQYRVFKVKQKRFCITTWGVTETSPVAVGTPIPTNHHPLEYILYVFSDFCHNLPESWDHLCVFVRKVQYYER